MNKKFGIHFYINIDNLEKIIRKDENKNEDLARSFHQLDTFISSIEKFVENFSSDCIVEKFTTSRLHLYYKVKKTNEGVPDESSLKNAIIRVFQIICFAKCLVNNFKDIGKYKNLPEYRIGAGIDIGDFVEFVFEDNGVSEMTTIGSPANRAAKLQSAIVDDDRNDILISRKFYESILMCDKDLASAFFGRGDLSSKIATKPSYTDLTAYGGEIKSLLDIISKYKYWDDRKKRGIDFAKQKANSTNIGDIDFSTARKPVNFETLSLKNPKIVAGAMFYSDIRGFTNKVDMSKLSEAEQFTKLILKMMFACGQNEEGVHIQFQGDRESAVFYDHIDMSNDYVVSAIITGMKMLDKIDEINSQRAVNKINIGIGIAIGDIFLSRLGLKNGKFNIALGETVRMADIAEDDKAGTRQHGEKSEIAITADTYKYIVKLAETNEIANNLKQIFEPYSNKKEFYVSSERYSKIKIKNSSSHIDKNSFFPLVSHRAKIYWELPCKPSIGIRCRYKKENETTYQDYREGDTLPKKASLIFEPTYLPDGWEHSSIKWQVTNTGQEAANVGQLRGGIENSNTVLKRNKNTGRYETTEYKGLHYIQCFFVRNNRDCFAMSKYFVVKIGD